MSNQSFAWVVVPNFIQTGQSWNGYFQALLVDNDLNIIYKNNFLETSFSDNLPYPTFKTITDNYNNLIFIYPNSETSQMEIFKISNQNSKHFAFNMINIDGDININILSNNNFLITIITNQVIYYYILDKNLNLIKSGNTPYNGLGLFGNYSIISISNNTVRIGNAIYDYNLQVIIPNINFYYLYNSTDDINFIRFVFDYFNNNSLMWIDIYNNTTYKYLNTFIVLGDNYGNMISYIEMPFIDGKSVQNNINFFIHNPNYFNTLYLIAPLNANNNTNLSIYKLNFISKSYEFIIDYPTINILNDSRNFIFYNYNYNIIYPFCFNVPYDNNLHTGYLGTITPITFNTFNLGNTVTVSSFIKILSNGQLLDFNSGYLNLYDENLNLIKSKAIYPSYITNTYTATYTAILPLSNTQTGNMTIVYNPLLCKSYTANEILEST